MEDNTEKIKNSLKVMYQVFKGLEDYRIFGSLLIAALNDKPHRELHDIDIFIDEKISEKIADRFEKLGFKKIIKHAFFFKWYAYEKPGHLAFEILLTGKFNRNYFEYKPNKFFTLNIDTEYLKPTNYELYGSEIKGIPLNSIYEGIKITNLNTKRKIEKEIVYKQTGGRKPKGLSINQAFHVRILGIEIPYLYTICFQIYNLIGSIRLKLGKSYDIWS